MYANQLLSKSKPNEGTAIIAYHQTRGKGQYGNKWDSSPGKNLTLSIILYPVFLSPDSIFRLNQAISLGIYDVCTDILPGDVRVKWPNDILFIDDQGKAHKLAGLLIENALSSTTVKSSIVGVGLNVNQQHFPDYITKAASLASILGRELSLQKVLDSLFTHIERRYLQLRSGREIALQEDYLNALYRYNQKSKFRAGDYTFEGVILGVRPSGLLVIQSDSGIREFAFKEVQLL